MIRFTSGDMFDKDHKINIFINPVNTQGTMGKGLAKEFARRYPSMEAAYQRRCKEGKITIGSLHVWSSGGDKIIINFPTKDHWKDPSEYEYVEKGLIKLATYLKGLDPKYKNSVVGIPALGCGLGGLSWAKVRTMLIQHLSDVEMEILVFNPT
jgi:O-acetyl-ADP-ribose deacetylase (regulator of RNase III)